MCLDLKQGDHIDYQDYYRSKNKNLIFRGFQWFEEQCILPMIKGATRNTEKRAEKIEEEGLALDDILSEKITLIVSMVKKNKML